MSKEAMKLALEALKTAEDFDIDADDGYYLKAIKALEEALAGKQEQGEPVALDVTLTEEESEFLRDTIGDDDVSPIRLTVGHGHSGYGLYVSNVDYQDEGASLIANTTPQQRKPLTEEQLIDLWPSLIMHQHTYAFARAIEAAHGIKE